MIEEVPRSTPVPSDRELQQLREAPSTWTGDEQRDAATWTLRWDDDVLLAARDLAARIGIKRLAQMPSGDIADLAHPELVAFAIKLRRELIDGRGFVLLRGLAVEDLDTPEIASIFMTLGTLIGSPRSQNAHGHLLGHVCDIGADPTDPKSRIYQTNQRQTFHTDSTDVVGLLCLRTAKSGGSSLLASAAAVLCEMVDRQRDLALELFEPVATDRRGEQPPGADPWFEIPVLSWFDQHLTVLYQRQYIDSAKRFADAPRLSERQIQALDLFDQILNEPTMHVAMELQPGDIQFVHNHALLHDRTGFMDHQDVNERRHLLRLWLSIPADRLLPPSFAQRYGSIEVGDRGGILVEDTEFSVPLSP